MPAISHTRSWLALRLSWAFIAGCVVAGTVLGVVALFMTREIVARDPCARGWDNPVALVMGWVCLTGIAASVGSLGIAVGRKVAREIVISASCVAFVPLFSLLAVVFASAGYGWHCPEY